MNTALLDLGLSDYFAELKTCQQYLNQSQNHRREILSVRPLFNVQDAKTRIINAIDNLLNAIELARVENTELDYMPLINELNVLIISRQSLIRSRNTRSKNSVANKTTTVALSPTTTATAI
jgi:hypothetical protein